MLAHFGWMPPGPPALPPPLGDKKLAKIKQICCRVEFVPSGSSRAERDSDPTVTHNSSWHCLCPCLHSRVADGMDLDLPAERNSESMQQETGVF